ncbi:MAG: hypothetical protein JWN25_1003, partial [Verrucomicrobiales bacterium]|nr:hypothetical protein [Verrucomicrobiales bacterium]
FKLRLRPCSLNTSFQRKMDKKIVAAIATRDWQKATPETMDKVFHNSLGPRLQAACHCSLRVKLNQAGPSICKRGQIVRASRVNMELKIQSRSTTQIPNLTIS